MKKKEFQEFKVNYSKITWLKRSEGLKTTVMVLAVSVAAGSLISFADFVGKCGVSLFV